MIYFFIFLVFALFLAGLYFNAKVKNNKNYVAVLAILSGMLVLIPNTWVSFVINLINKNLSTDFPIPGALSFIDIVIRLIFITAIAFIYYKFVHGGTNHSDSDQLNPYFIGELKRKNQKIDCLKEELKNSTTLETKISLSNTLESRTQERDAFKEKAGHLEKQLRNTDTEIAQKVNAILSEKGADAALEYLEGIDFDKDTQKMAENAKALLTQASLYDLENKHDKANETYIKSLKFNRTIKGSLEYADYLSHQNNNLEVIRQLKIIELELSLKPDEKLVVLGDLANAYQEQNRLSDAEQAYDEALGLYRGLAKSNPSAYAPDVAMTLNNLANLYSDQGRLSDAEQAYDEALKLRRGLAKSNPSAYAPYVATTLNNLAALYSDQNRLLDAEQAYDEALGLYRDLAKSNPSAYGIDYAQMLIMDVDMFEKPKTELETAEHILKRYDEDNYQANKWLDKIKQLREK